jgi:hypothetical protein
MPSEVRPRSLPFQDVGLTRADAYPQLLFGRKFRAATGYLWNKENAPADAVCGIAGRNGASHSDRAK